VSNELSIGTWMQLASPSVAEILSSQGFDWIAVDAEHGEYSKHELINIFRAIEVNGVKPYVRIPFGGIHEVKISLDSGAKGIIIPMVESSSQLKETIDFIFYPPRGKRGVGFSRANSFGQHFNEYLSKINNELVIVAQIENIKAVENLDEILAVDGLSSIMVGPYDLSASMGITGEFDNPVFVETLKSIKEKCLKSDVGLGYHVVEPSASELKSRIDEGYTFIAYGIDTVFLRNSSVLPDIGRK